MWSAPPIGDRDHLARRMRRRDRRGLGRELLPRLLVDAVAQDAVLGRRVVQDLELADALTHGALRAGLAPQVRALALAGDSPPVAPDRLAIAARAADHRVPVALLAVAHVALVVVPGRHLARTDEAAACIAEPRLPGLAQPGRHRVTRGVRVAEEFHRDAAADITAIRDREPGEQRVERARRRGAMEFF